MAKSYKAIVSVPGWAEQMMDGDDERDKITSPSAAYAYVPLIYRAVKIRCDALIRPRLVVENKAGEEVDYPFPSDPKDLLWKTEASLLLAGANYVEKINRRMTKKTADLNWINPLTMESVKRVELEDGTKQLQFKQKNNPKTWTTDDMVYMREFSLTDDIQAGVSSGSVALNDAALIRYMGRSVAKFFETGMMPVTLLQVQGLVDPDEAKRIEGFFKKLTKGIRNIWRVLAVTKEIEPKVISQPLKDMVIPEINKQAERSVAHAFGFNPSLFDESNNYATAKEYRLGLYQDTVEPRGEWICEQLNRQVFTPMGLKIRLAFEELDIYQEDENQKAQSVQTLTSAIATDAQAALFVMQEIFGYDMTEDALAEYKRIFLTEKKPEPVPEQVQQQPPAQPDEQQPPQDKALVEDLERWQKKAVNLLNKGESPFCEFTSEHIHTKMAEEIKAELRTCKTVDDIRYTFGSIGGGDLGIRLLLAGVNRELEGIAKAKA